MAICGICQYGKRIKMRLLDDDINQTQEWLIAEVRRHTGLYFDRSYLHKIMIGKVKTPTIITAINEILDLKSVSDNKENT